MSHYVIGDLHLAFSVNKPKDILVVFGIFLKGLNKMKIINLVEDTKGNSACEYEHGLSFYVETKKHKILVDTGATDMFMRNAQVLNVDLEQIDVVVLSHGHYDHAGGIMSFSKLNKKAGIYAQSTVGGEYYNLTDKKEKYIGIDKRILQLPQYKEVNGELKLDEELFLFSNITGRKYPAKGNLNLKIKETQGFIQDIFQHEQCLVITEGKKRILMSGCAHNGILNILERYEELFDSEPDVVISGFHMMQKEEYTAADVENIKDIANILKEKDTIFYTGHCTGEKAFWIMKEIMGEKLRWIHSGDSLENM